MELSKVFKVGDKIAAKATLFDPPGSNSWSENMFGDVWATASCTGSVIKLLARVKKALVKRDVDQKSIKIDLNLLQKLKTNTTHSSDDPSGKLVILLMIFNGPLEFLRGSM